MVNPPPQAEHQHATLSGRWLVALTMSLFLLVPTITYFSWKATQGTPQRAALDYDQRGGWFMQPVISRPLKYSKFVAAETGKQYKRTDLIIDPDVEAVLQRCAAMAQSPDFFDRTDSYSALLILSGDEANGFYPPYLLAAWYLNSGDTESHDRWMRVAFERADTAVAQKLIDDKGNPVAGYELPPVAIGYDRVTGGKLDATLVLIYPRPTSHDNGFVYLPVYRSAYRFADPALPLGVDPGLHPTLLTLLPQPSNGTDPNWFAVPDGAVGRLDDAVIERAKLKQIEELKRRQAEDKPGNRIIRLQADG
ncbi:MAG: hypothetical protein AAGC72_00735 [Planctomycetota bacterium]